MPKKLTGREVKRVREAIGMTQTEFAAVLQMKLPQISRMENSEQELTKCWQHLLRYIEQDKGALLKKLQKSRPS